MLDRRAAKVLEERNSRKQPLSEDEARRLIESVDKVFVGRGRSAREIAAGEATPDELKGPTGNFRAPMIRSGKILLVGFHQPTLEGLLAE